MTFMTATEYTPLFCYIELPDFFELMIVRCLFGCMSSTAPGGIPRDWLALITCNLQTTLPAEMHSSAYQPSDIYLMHALANYCEALYGICIPHSTPPGKRYVYSMFTQVPGTTTSNAIWKQSHSTTIQSFTPSHMSGVIQISHCRSLSMASRWPLHETYATGSSDCER